MVPSGGGGRVTRRDDPFAQCRGCRYLGRDDEDGWPVCRHPDAQDKIEHADCIPAICVQECPIGRWRRVNGARVARGQQTLEM